MKNLLMVGLLFSSLTASAMNIGRVDVQKVLLSVKESKQIKDKLQKEIDKKQAELKKEEESLVKEKEKFEKQALVMNEKTKQKKGQELQKKFFTFQQKMQKYQGELAKMEQSAKGPILNKIKAVVEEVSKKKGLDWTYETSTTPILYIKKVTDITNDVITAYDKKHK
ncbi:MULTISPECIES: OmpH family outer membrane protein [Halobacteriovorax]|uniref:OmpH family outer membrane protein n=1 Tax=Halobacteriovorax vibrionivorans TaxID=2152716 RepID=A0ABY0IH53_9BACT|nr:MULTISPECIES: OmpH family outer membrane protein [Halobacteriovorax]AYF43456.1 outer membrane protein, OmpH-like protein [Halobacteriovorax sp. BALOs_7]RZF21972.1 OmpH family outer membrane protein [Halobacteriovorax vibrionivorans]TGD46473.1 OmpH family outer membrane protein [Halobacteriovorax sp. Y22]